MPAPFCQRCGKSCGAESVTVLIDRPDADSRRLCKGCIAHVQSALLEPAVFREELAEYRARPSRARLPTRGGLDKAGTTFADLLGRYPEATPIRRRRPA
jgi:hypothetical protein